MIPSNHEIKKKINLSTANYFVLNSESFFQKAEEFVVLQQRFIKESLFDKIMLWFDMVISPILTLISCIVSGELPSVFTILGIHKLFSTWLDWFYFKSLASEIQEWRRLVKGVNGPFISTNDPLYHVFVYADGMERLRSSLFEA